MYAKKAYSVQVTKVPHWLRKGNYTDRERETILGRYLILKMLAKYGPLSMYAIWIKIKEEEKKDIPYPRIRRYIQRLEEKRHIYRVRQLEESRRKEKVYAVENGVICILYFHHFLTKPEFMQVFEKQSRLVPMFKKMGLSKEIGKVIESQLAPDMLYVLAYVHSPARIYDIDSSYAEDIGWHAQETRFRDIENQLLLFMLEKLVENDTLSEHFKQYAASNPELLIELQSAEDTINNMLDSFKKCLAKLMLMSKLLADIKKSADTQPSLNYSGLKP